MFFTQNKKFYSNYQSKRNHPYHLVDNSPWPFYVSVSIFCLIIGVVGFFHLIEGCLGLIYLSLFSLILSLTRWFGDIIREGTFEGHHTKAVQQNLRIGGVLFILSEGMFFFSFFWAYFHFSLVPAPGIGCVWPPKGIVPINPWELPLLNTFLLLTSGASLTWAHCALINGFKKQTLLALFITLFLSSFFMCIQYYEYTHASFNISDGVYGSIFYLLTGFHGLHVFVGSIMLGVSFLRTWFDHFTREQHIGFEISAWYWHFVDVVWLLVYLFVYVWGS